MKGRAGRGSFSECIAERTREDLSVSVCLHVCVYVFTCVCLNIIMANETRTLTRQNISIFRASCVREMACEIEYTMAACMCETA